MEIKCSNCQELNSSGQTFCNACKKSLLSAAAIIEQLIKKQEALEARHRLELNSLKEEISFIQQHLSFEDEQTKSVEAEQTNPIPAHQPSIQSTASQEPIPAEEFIKTQPVAKEKFQEEKQEVAPTALELKIREFLEPLHTGVALINSVYDKYKEEGKLPIFFMTIAGIIAILFGFGYLMQYSMQYLGDYAAIVKIGLGFTSAFVIGGIGIRLYVKNESYKEYGSALISLGLILNYLMIYFLSDLGNFPLLASSILGFILIIINTGVAIFLSLRFETKIVAVLFLLGGALTPFYLHSTSDGSMYYLYLWFLTMGANIVAYKIGWKPLHYLSFVVSFSLLEFAVFNYMPTAILFTGYYHLFAYLFFYFVIFDKFSIKASLTKYDIIILSGNLSFFLFNIYIAFHNQYALMGLLYLVNAVVFGVLLLRFWKGLNKETQLAIFVVIGSFVGFAIPALVHQSLMGLFWSIEAIALILLGFIYAIPIVRKEGYIILSIAIIKLIISSHLLLDRWDTSIWHEGFLNYIVLGAVVSALWAMSRKFSTSFTDFEKSVYKWCKELIPLWLSSVFFIISYGLVGIWGLNLSVIPMFGLIYWSKRFNTKYSNPIGMAHLFFLLISLSHSFAATGSLHLSDQFLYAQISMLELMASLWFLRKYYELLNFKENETFKIAHLLRISFFVLIPLIFINFVRRNTVEFIEPAIWIIILMTFFMHKRLHYKALLFEVYFLCFFAFSLSLEQPDVAGLSLGFIALLVILFVEKAHSEEGVKATLFRPLLLFAPYLIFFSISLLNYELVDDNLGLAMVLFSLFLFTGVYFKSKIAVLNSSYVMGTKLASSMHILGLLALLFDHSIAGIVVSIVSLLLFGLLLKNNQGWYDMGPGRKRWATAIIVHQVQIIFFYCLVILSMGLELDGILLTVLLVIHAIIMLFLSLKNRVSLLNKISLSLFGIALLKVVFNDIRDFDTAQKVIVLIILGALLLGASYGYLKLKKYFEVEEIEMEDKTTEINNNLE